MKRICAIFGFWAALLATGFTDDAPKGPRKLIGCVRESDPGLSERNRAAITAARTFLEKGGKAVDAYYKVEDKAGQRRVFVLFVGGYGKDDQPIIKPGGFNDVLLDKDNQVLKVLPGA